MTELQQALAEKADRALDAARANLERGDAETATNRAYYACFYVAQSALAGLGESPKTHSGTLARFQFHFVRNGPLRPSLGATLRVTFGARQRLDYDALELSDTRAAADLVTDAEQFVAAVRELL